MRQVRIALADKLDDLGALVSLEMGKILPVRRANYFARSSRIVRRSKRMTRIVWLLDVS